MILTEDAVYPLLSHPDEFVSGRHSAGLPIHSWELLQQAEFSWR